ncbi:hypothetical protein AHAS_Ahas12G0149000 [Arachis hypogaea]
MSPECSTSMGVATLATLISIRNGSIHFLWAGNVDVLNCYYAHGEDNENFQRKSEHIVLVHYRDTKEQWSRWQRRKPDADTVFLKAMAEIGQVKLYGEHPTLIEMSLYRARRHLYKEERLQAEEDKLEEIGPMAYYSEWVKAWKGDTSREAIQKHFKETGEDETAQLIEMFSHQTDREYRIMIGTDVHIKRDPLAMRMKEKQIKKNPNEVIDYRGLDFHEPTPNMLSYLMEHGHIITREELNTILAKEKPE